MHHNDPDSEDGKAEGGSRLIWLLCIVAAWLLILFIVLVLRRGWTFPEF
jgi:hypothetical protein